MHASTTNIVSAEVGGVTTALGLVTMKAGAFQTAIGIPALASGRAGVVPIATGFATTTAGTYVTEYGGYILNNSIKDQNYNYSKFEEAIGDGVNVEKQAPDFEKKISKMSSNDRVAAVKTKINSIIDDKGFIKDNKLTKINNRDVYRDPSTGDLYAVDTQHGRFEKLNSKNGKHLGEVDIDFNPIKNSIDKSGQHDLKLK